MQAKQSDLLATLDGTLVVSCQAESGLPLDAPGHIAAMARSVVLGGATGVRIEGAANIAAVRAAVEVPLIGLIKVRRDDTEVYITPTLDDVAAVIEAGADIVAIDATSRPHPAALKAMFASIAARGRLSMGDVATLDEGKRALDAGADLISTTMAGYTDYSSDQRGPAFALMEEFARAGLPFVAEGRIWSPDEAVRCFELGARFIVVGGAITRPDAITRRFADVVAAWGARPQLRRNPT
ncbi:MULTISPECIES: N-acetylmannosamine-6-phosphate 2-epimerase [unclassified Mesorhizobium]|uniref:N-acetylmannosamine-6-phosphate 2-epimerase n=1 Tax=unclassified Mesorhizobium TaxID=325217 RepID=UPI000FE8D7B6|nr:MULTISPECIES: N-acetylmannosamine-6-phosphate 2-epimerase [unclassified Mesorhizobium]RWB73243.1 MAG: putative N-acetylmannosamine-6-phosphate 2-epimerase [Mesorhizobium sp.]RWB90837.1 MAG: putative N-acetylmannosamine-6-phosphate 2-epimerase [Mesorhizobium sp.]TGS64066.1 putative N-acetylmannosamine-6-phosphate 2-epimerase [Mesorhizobium sp. M3A.F.Ca.ET.201.01.1.1]TGS85790.1 putative N-acetylmannosamine-6-phosphate 2-epimerase [Mesorhizobium sp. M3A.F.Ca.ET.175.01.1.1]TGT23900.1 putative N